MWRPALSALVALALTAGSGAALARGDVPCTLVAFQPTCQVIVAPGPTLDTIEAVRVVGAPSYASAGELRLTTIEVFEEEGWAAWWRARSLPAHESVARTRFVPAGSDVDAVAAANRRAMEESRRVATVAALAELGVLYQALGANEQAIAAFSSRTIHSVRRSCPPLLSLPGIIPSSPQVSAGPGSRRKTSS